MGWNTWWIAGCVWKGTFAYCNLGLLITVMIMQNINAVIFDMDGLLLDSERLYLDSFLSTCSHFGIGDLSDVFMRGLGTNAEMGKEILTEGLKGLVGYEAFCSVWDELIEKFSTENPIPLKQGAQNLLDALKVRNIPMAVATSSDTHLAKTRLSDIGILSYFKSVTGGDKVSNSKPSPEIYVKAANKLGVTPAECLVLEDSSNGVRSAVAAGMRVIQIPDLIEPDSELLKLGHTVLNSLDEVVNLYFEANKLF